MIGLRLCALALIVMMPSPAQAGSETSWRRYSAEASARFGIPVDWIERVIRIESAGRNTLGGRPIVSRAGAMGLMQLMPGTWATMRETYKLGSDPFDPRDNIIAGTAYLRMMYDRFGYPGMFAAYNAGPGRYAAFLVAGRALPDETRAYLAAVTDGKMRRGQQAVFRGQTAGQLFSILPGTTRDQPRSEEAAPRSVLLVIDTLRSAPQAER